MLSGMNDPEMGAVLYFINIRASVVSPHCLGPISACVLNGEPGADRNIHACKGVVASIHERCVVRRKPGEFRPPEKSVEHIGRHGVAGFNLHGIKKPGFLDQEIDLVPSPVAPEEQGKGAAVVEIGLCDLCDHVVLEDRPSEWMRNDLAGIADAKKLTK